MAWKLRFGEASTAKQKKSHRGMEKNWNKFSEGFRQYLSGSYPINSGWLKYKRRNDPKINEQ